MDSVSFEQVRSLLENSAAKKQEGWTAQVTKGLVNYQWHQNEDTITIIVKLREKAGRRDVDVSIKSAELHAGVKGKGRLISGRLFAAISPDASTWHVESSPEGTLLEIHLEKLYPGLWTYVIQPGDHIDGQSEAELSRYYSMSKDDEKAVLFMKRAAEKQYIPALLCLGSLQLREEDRPPTLEYDVSLGYANLHTAAALGSGEAYYHIGYGLQKGIGVVSDLPSALRAFETSAGIPSDRQALAAHAAAVLYSLGKGGVEQNHERAASYWTFAAREGVPAAHYNLGIAYVNGMGVPKDAAKAKACFELAKRGDANLEPPPEVVAFIEANSEPKPKLSPRDTKIQSNGGSSKKATSRRESKATTEKKKEKKPAPASVWDYVTLGVAVAAVAGIFYLHYRSGR
eukprot:Colp12_sorted_trinity150504_noHs@24434